MHAFDDLCIPRVVTWLYSKNADSLNSSLVPTGYDRILSARASLAAACSTVLTPCTVCNISFVISQYQQCLSQSRTLYSSVHTWTHRSGSLGSPMFAWNISTAAILAIQLQEWGHWLIKIFTSFRQCCKVSYYSAIYRSQWASVCELQINWLYYVPPCTLQIHPRT